MSERDLDRLVDGYVEGTISRRQFIRGGLALGISLTSISAFLAACSSSAATAPPSVAAPASAAAPSAAAPSAAPASASAAPTATELSVIAWGGGYGRALKQFVSDPFEQATNVKVLVQEQSQAEQSRTKLQAEMAAPTIDVWLTTGALPLEFARLGGLLELTPAEVPNLADVIPALNQTLDGKIYGAGIHLGARTITVDNQRIKSIMPDYNIDMLNSWAFLWRPELKDQISLNGFESGLGTAYIGQTMHRGGSQTDEEAFFKAMKDLAPNVHLDLGGASGIGELQLFQTKEIMVSSNNMTDAQELAQNGISVDIGYPQDPLITLLDYIVAVKNGPAGPVLAFDYINRILDPVAQTPYEELLGQLPTNKKAAPPTLTDLPPLSVDTVLAKAWAPDYDLALKNYDAWFARYKQEVVPLFGK